MPRGKNDPGRRERIARAAIEVVAEKGVAGLTHRAVATKADLPLGSTTYHFASLEDLLASGIEQAKIALDQRLSEWAEELGDEPDLPAALAALLATSSGSARERGVVEYELYLAALRRPALRQLAYEWDRALPTVLTRFTDPVTANALAMTVDGVLLQSLVRGTPVTVDEIEPMFAKIMS
ncbi:MAG: TetR/AcrR family transcriptional regulator [Solirubrobacterales bacterium]